MTEEEIGYAIERRFVKKICDKLEERGLPHSHYGWDVWGKYGERVWRQIRNANPPRRITIEEAVRMSSALEDDFINTQLQAALEIYSEIE